MIPSAWFDAALLGIENAELCAQTFVMLLYCLLQNSEYPLHLSPVFDGLAALDVPLEVLVVPLLVPVGVAAPTTVKE